MLTPSGSVFFQGFRKIDPERWEFANEDFIRGHTHLLKNIHRRKPVHSHSLQNQVNGPLAEAERRELEDEINRLKYEKSLLLADLQRQNQQQYGISWQMQSLEDRLVQMEQRQRNIVASLCDILKRHRVVSASMLETDHFSKKRRVPKIDFFVDEPTVKEQQVPFLQTLGAEAPSMPPGHLLNAEPFEKMELALVSLENFFQRASHGSAEEMYGGVAETSPDLTLGEMNSAPMDTSINQQSSAGLSPFSSTTEQAHFPSSLADSVSYAPSPIPWSCIEGMGIAMRRRRCILQDRARTGPSPPHRLPRLPLFVSWKSSIASLSSVVPSDFQVG